MLISLSVFMVMNAACLMCHLIQKRMKRLFLVILCSFFVAYSVAARETSDDTVLSCKAWVNGTRYSFKQTFRIVSARLERAKKCFVFKLPDADVEVAVYRKSKERYVISVNDKCYEYDVVNDVKTKTSSELSLKVLKKKLELWGKKKGYCMALSKQKKRVLIIYER